MVGTGRFELPTPRTPSECSTRLSHVPTIGNPLPKTGDRNGRVCGNYSSNLDIQAVRGRSNRQTPCVISELRPRYKHTMKLA